MGSQFGAAGRANFEAARAVQAALKPSISGRRTRSSAPPPCMTERRRSHSKGADARGLSAVRVEATPRTSLPALKKTAGLAKRELGMTETTPHRRFRSQKATKVEFGAASPRPHTVLQARTSRLLQPGPQGLKDRQTSEAGAPPWAAHVLKTMIDRGGVGLVQAVGFSLSI